MFAFLNSRGSDGSDLDAALTAAGGAESVVIVARDIPAGEKITADMLKTQSVPAAALLAGRHTSTDGLVGKVATAPMYAGEQVLDSKVTTYVGQNTLAYKVPDGMRALSLQIPHEAWANAGLAQPGDKVDVLGVTTTMKVDPLTGEEKPNVVAWYLAQDVEVLAFAQTTVKVIPNVDGTLTTVPVTSEDVTTPSTPATTTDSTKTGTTPEGTTANGAQITDPKSKPGDEAPHYETAVSITLALPPDIAAQVTILDAMKDDIGQYRIVTRQKGDDTKITGTTSWTFDDMFTKK
jgi:Flp pilus assembly protein CpaB